MQTVCIIPVNTTNMELQLCLC